MVNCQRKLACKIRRLAISSAIPRVVIKSAKMKSIRNVNFRDPRWAFAATESPHDVAGFLLAVGSVKRSSHSHAPACEISAGVGRARQVSMEKCGGRRKGNIRRSNTLVSCENCRAKTSCGFASFGNFAEKFPILIGRKGYDLFDSPCRLTRRGPANLKNGKVVFEDYDWAQGLRPAGRHSRWPSLCRPPLVA